MPSKQSTKQSAKPKEQQRQHALESLLRQPKPLRWMRAEWMYDPAEHIFFNESNTFGCLLNDRMPKLRTRQLTIAEWRKTRRLFVRAKCRRFSGKFIAQTRQALELYRRRHRILALNPHYQPADGAKLAMVNPPALCRLMVMVGGLLATKATIIGELKQINGSGTIAESNGKRDKSLEMAAVSARLSAVNEQLFAQLDKLCCYPAVQKALLFDALDKSDVSLQLSPENFRQLCAFHVNQLHADICTNAALAQACPTVTELLDVLLELMLAVLDQRLMVSGCRDYFYNLLSEQYGKLQLTMVQEHIEYFQRNCLEFLNLML